MKRICLLLIGLLLFPTAKSSAAPPGIVLDDTMAELEGSWGESTKLTPLIGSGYRHDNRRGDGKATATFRPQIPAAGEYEVRLFYTGDGNRSSRTKVQVHAADGVQTAILNQRLPVLMDGVPRALGVFRFAPGEARVVISNAGADGYVTIDGLQVLPVELAKSERAGDRKSGFPFTAPVVVKRPAARTQPVVPRSVTPEFVATNTFDLCVIEATPGGVACAVGAAREGLRVLLVNHTAHLGGILASGLGVWDTLWEGRRSPIYDELRQSILDYYRTSYGPNSQEYRDALPGRSGHTNGKFESHVVEQLITDLVAAETNITLLVNHVPVSGARSGRRIHSIWLRELGGKGHVMANAAVFADCTYEGDLMARLNIEHRFGREGREEFNEPHAGRIFVKGTRERSALINEEQWRAHEALKLRKFHGFQEILLPASSGAGDTKVQAFNYRTTLSTDPKNQMPVTKPDDYDPEELRDLEWSSVVAPIPNQKRGWNRPQLVGLQESYVLGDWLTRQQVMDAHWRAVLGKLWFMRNDPSVPESKRTTWRQVGLAKDDYIDNGHRPYEIYVREGRRLVGRHVLTQHDVMPLPDSIRTPVQADAIAMIDWYMDSHACTWEKTDGSLHEGKMMLHAETFPGQISWRSLLPKDCDNFVVPVCLSSTHVAWGAIRLEPTWMQTGEAAGIAVALAKKRGIKPGELDGDVLLRELVKRRFLLCFVNDVDRDDPAFPAVQYFGSKGFFSDYDAKLDEPLSEALATEWQRGFKQLRAGSLKPNELAARCHAAGKVAGAMSGRTRRVVIMGMWQGLK